MTNAQCSRLVALIAERVTRSRFQHILRVEALAVELARFWNVPEDKARTAALLHDVARDIPDDVLVDMATAATDPLAHEMSSTAARVVLHAPVGALIAQRDFGVSDPDVLRAIALHTTGDAVMSPLAMIIFLADYCEAGRDFPGVEQVRVLLHKDLREAMALALQQTLAYLTAHARPIDERTVRAEQAFAAMTRGSHQP